MGTKAPVKKCKKHKSSSNNFDDEELDDKEAEELDEEEVELDGEEVSLGRRNGVFEASHQLRKSSNGELEHEVGLEQHQLQSQMESVAASGVTVTTTSASTGMITEQGMLPLPGAGGLFVYQRATAKEDSSEP